MKNRRSRTGFCCAYQTLLGHRLRFAVPAGRNDSLQAAQGGEGSMLLQLKGKFVLLLDAPTPARAMQLADDVWQSLDAETEPVVIPFDLATRGSQLSLRSK
jgi:hypothetical protein